MKNMAKPVALQWIASMSVPALFVGGGGYSLMHKMLKKYGNRGISLIMAIAMVLSVQQISLTNVLAMSLEEEIGDDTVLEEEEIIQGETNVQEGGGYGQYRCSR